MVRHCVFIRFKPETRHEKIRELLGEIDGLKHHLDGVLAVHVGINVSPEKGMDKGYSNGFMVDFENSECRDRYLADTQHLTVGAKLVEAALGGVDGILVYDMNIETH